MRELVGSCFIVILASAAPAQDQERKLVDRLLKPDMTLQSPDQNKQFVADKTLVDKRAPVSTFYLQKKSNGRNFGGTRDFSTQPFSNQRSSPAQGKTANLSSRTTPPASTYATASLTEVNRARDADKRKGTRDYPGQRPFLEQGKSQKSLSRQNTPLTIEQVRELLNKNK